MHSFRYGSGFGMQPRFIHGRCVIACFSTIYRYSECHTVGLQVVSSYELAPKALFVFEKDNFIRKPMIRFVRWKLFDWTMLIVILANCVTLAMDSNRPGFPDSTMGMALTKANYVFIGIFMFEAACKIIALGFLFAEHTYLRSGRFHQYFY